MKTREGRCQFHRWELAYMESSVDRCVDCGKTRPTRLTNEHKRTELRAGAIPNQSKSVQTLGVRKPLKRGRGFAASPQQQKKVEGMACVGCGSMANEWTVIDPGHLCARGMGGCDDPLCVVPLCRVYGRTGCHPAFDAGELDLAQFLEPAFRAEVAHCVMHLGLEGTRVRLAPSQYRAGRAA